MTANKIRLDQQGFLSITRWKKEDKCWCPFTPHSFARQCGVQCPHFGRFDKNTEMTAGDYPYVLKLSCGHGAYIATAEIVNEYDA